MVNQVQVVVAVKKIHIMEKGKIKIVMEITKKVMKLVKVVVKVLNTVAVKIVNIK